MENQILCVLAETYGLRIYAIMLPPSDFWVAHYMLLRDTFDAHKHVTRSNLKNVFIKMIHFYYPVP